MVHAQMSDMTAEQFTAWRKRHFRSRQACADAIGRSASMIRDLEKGFSPVPKYMAIICVAYDKQALHVPSE